VLDLKETNKGLREKEEKIYKLQQFQRNIIDNTNIWINMLDNKENVTLWNKVAEKISGYSAQEVIGHNKIWEWLYPEEEYRKEISRKAVAIIEKGEAEEDSETTIRCKDGKVKIISWNSQNLTDSQGEIIGSISIGRDITEYKQVEQAMLESEKRYRELFNHMSSGVIIYEAKENGRDFIIKNINPAVEKIEKIKKEDILGKSVLKVFPAVKDSGLFKVFQEVWKTGKPQQHLLSLYQDQRITGWRENYIYRLPSGEIVAVYDDITDRRLAEKELKESEEKYRTVFENTGTAMIIIEEDMTISVANRQFEQLSGYSKEEIENKIKWTKFIIPEDLEKMKEYHLLRRKEKESTPTSYEFSLRNKLGEIKNIWLKVGMIPGTKKSVASLTDITARKTYEGKLKKSIEDVIYTIGKITETRDPYTSGHQLKVSKLSTAIAQEMKLPQDKIEGIRIASLVHDIGKISIPSEILSKPSKLSEIEYRLIKNHSQIGYDILKSIEFPWPVAEIVLQHQERLNGSGYPQGLKGDDILLEAKIIAVADVIEAMSSHRPYRPALGINKALEEIFINRGILYVPEVVDACIKLFKEKDFKF
jgi:PAS domain S-box-containing protein/putative nucleotidyltransferase with HDIG domain